MVVHASSVVGVGVGEVSGSSIFLGEKLLDFPGVRLDAHRELEVLLCDRVPELKGM